MKWIKLQIQDEKMRTEIAGLLCECGFQVYCSYGSLSFSPDTKVHYVNVMVDATCVVDIED